MSDSTLQQTLREAEFARQSQIVNDAIAKRMETVSVGSVSDWEAAKAAAREEFVRDMTAPVIDTTCIDMSGAPISDDEARQDDLILVVTIPHYSKPSQDMPLAQNALRYLRLSVHSEAKCQLMDDQGEIHDVEPADLWDKAQGSA